MKTNLLKYFLLVVLLSLNVKSLLAQAPAKVWDKRFGGNLGELLSTMTSTPDGGYILGGWSNSGNIGEKSQASKGGYDYWIVKIDAQGNKTWDKTFGGDGTDHANRIIVTADGGYLVAGTSNSGIGSDKTEPSKGMEDFWILKLNADGSKAWDKTIGGSLSDAFIAVTTTADGGYLLGGQSYSNAGGDKSENSRGGNDSDYWVVKLNADGSKVWDRTYGGSGNDFLYNLASTPDGGFILGGFSNSGTGGDKTADNKGNFDYWIVKLDADGNIRWDRSFGGIGHDYLTALTTTTDGGFLIAGDSESGAGNDKTEGFRGSFDYWVIKLNANGTKEWDKTFGGSGTEKLRTLLKTPDGGYLLGGYTDSGLGNEKSEVSKGLIDFWVVKLNADGSKAWDKAIGGANNDYLMAMSLSNNGDYLLGGYSNSGISSDKTVAAAGGYDYWVVKLNDITLSSLITDGETDNVVVYPNPSNGNFKIQYTDPNIGPSVADLTLYNMQGQQVLRRTVKGYELQQGFTLKTTSLSSGTYILNLQIQGKLLTKKLILN